MSTNAKPIAWHETCAANWYVAIKEKEKALARLQREVEQNNAELAFYNHQIREAERLNLFLKEVNNALVTHGWQTLSPEEMNVVWELHMMMTPTPSVASLKGYIRLRRMERRFERDKVPLPNV